MGRYDKVPNAYSCVLICVKLILYVNFKCNIMFGDQ